MKHVAAALAQLATVAFGFVLLAALLYEPWIEGVNANATSYRDVYFDDPFLAYIYFAFLFVFAGLFQAYNVFGKLQRGDALSERTARALRTIKNCALTFAGLIFFALLYLRFIAEGSDDIAGGTVIGLFLIISAIVAAGAARRFEKTIHAQLGA